MVPECACKSRLLDELRRLLNPFDSPGLHRRHGLHQLIPPLGRLLTRARRPSRGTLPRWPTSRHYDALVVGECHHPTEPRDPAALLAQARRAGPVYRVAIFGTVGTGKRSACMHPFPEQAALTTVCGPAEAGLRSRPRNRGETSAATFAPSSKTPAGVTARKVCSECVEEAGRGRADPP